MTGDAPQPGSTSLDETLGLEVIEVAPDRARGRLAVVDQVRQPFGLVHGGAFAAVAESLASRATYEAVVDDGMVALGLSNSTSFLRPVATGVVESEARCRHQGRSTWLWDVDHCDDAGRLCAVSRVTIAVRPRPPSG